MTGIELSIMEQERRQNSNALSQNILGRSFCKYEIAGAILFWLDHPLGDFAPHTVEHTFTYPACHDLRTGKMTDYDLSAIYAYRSAMPTSKPGASKRYS